MANPSRDEYKMSTSPSCRRRCPCRSILIGADICISGAPDRALLRGPSMRRIVHSPDTALNGDPAQGDISMATQSVENVTAKNIAIARAAYGAYVTKDRAALEKLIAKDFHFTSPLDNRLDRETYF